MTLRGQHYFKGDKPYPGMNVTAVYKFVKADGVFKAVRQGELQIFPPNFVPGQRQLSVREETIHTLLQRRLGKVLEPEMVAKGFTPKGKWAAVGKLQPVEMEAQGGWLVIGWRRAAAEKTASTALVGSVSRACWLTRISLSYALCRNAGERDAAHTCVAAPAAATVQR